MFDIRELEAFSAVMKTGNLTVASKQTQVPKSTLSRRIRQLEDSMGQALLRRQSQGLVPTEAGQTFNHYVEKILLLLDEGQTAVETVTETLRGELRICCHPALLRSWFGRIFRRFIEEYPEVQVTFDTRLLPPSLENDNRECICLWLGPEPNTSLRVHRLGQMSQHLYCAPHLAKDLKQYSHPAELTGYRWLELMLPLEQIQPITLFHPRNPPFSVPDTVSRIRVDQLNLQGDAIAQGFGIGLMPDWLVAGRQRYHPGTLESFMTDWQGPPLEVFLLHSHGLLSRRANAFISFIREALPDAWI